MSLTINPENFGDAEFRKDYRLRYACVSGAMYKGIASKELVVKMGKAGLMGFLGTGGLKLERIQSDIKFIQQQLIQGESYGMNLLCNIVQPEMEEKTVAIFLQHNIRFVEAAAYVQITPALVWFRLKGLKKTLEGKIDIPNHIMAKVSRPEVALQFMNPAPQKIVQNLVQKGQLTAEEAELGNHIPMAHEICVESDSGGHTDQRIALTLLPAIFCLRDQINAEFGYANRLRIGAGGGIGTPEAVTAAFVMGVDFVLTGSINQCTVEAGTSDAVKDILQDINIQDTTYAPAGDMFELGARVQVVRKGLLFAARANKLHALYTHFNSLDEIDPKTLKQIEERYFRRSIASVWEETKHFYLREKPDEIEKAERSSKHRMALIFRWYFIHTTRLAMKGDPSQVSDYQIHCGSALGAFNQWVKGTALESWRNRHVDEINLKLMKTAAEFLSTRIGSLVNSAPIISLEKEPIRADNVIQVNA